MKTYAEICLARANASTTGPWVASLDHNEWPKIIGVKGHCEGCVGWLAPYLDEDAEFIAHARTDVPELAIRLKTAIEIIKTQHKYIQMLGGNIKDIQSAIDDLEREEK